VWKSPFLFEKSWIVRKRSVEGEKSILSVSKEQEEKYKANEAGQIKTSDGGN